ncbi:RNA-guided endonuclease TnpB family protein [Geobacillus sp. E263]|uniref:RNA-guided endonuclease InsQ/TnpB family protein n=1 Tax=Geobacillus sp. E263 TaxID=391290 RepID=UPI001179D204|nr:RNA-guided endonuclease TnpB family protein [Geobacillus sp. E263]
MLCTLKIKLMPTLEQFHALLETMKRFNQACNYISEIAFRSRTFSKTKIQRLCYYDVREKFGLSAQMTVRAIGKVSESYRLDKKTLHNFKETGAIVYDERILSFKGVEYASILTLQGRMEIPMVISRYHQGLLCGNRVRGQADLVLQNGIFYLLLVVDVPEGQPNSENGFIGVDLGIINIAVDSTGEVFSGSKVNGLRRRHAKLRAKLQKKGTKSAKRLLKKRSKKEKLFARDVNHCISKKIVEKAKALGCGIALEDLKGIRQRTEKTVKKQQRRQHSSWSFYQLRKFIEYKAAIAGVPVVLVHPKNTSRTCPVCGHVAKENRPSRDQFCCRACGYAAPADNVAAENIRRAAVNQPNAAAN